MRNSKPGFGDLKRLRKESAIARRRDEAERKDQALRAGQDQKASQADALLFARVVQTVQPLGRGARGYPAPRASENHEDARARIAQRRVHALGGNARTGAAISDLAGGPQEPGSDLAFAAPGVGPDPLRRLRKAFWPVGAQLDLHGHTADQARDALARFIEQSRSCGTRCVRVIHGIGHGSAQGLPVLKSRVAGWLSQLPGVQAFATAPPAHGGRGAVMVLLRLP